MGPPKRKGRSNRYDPFFLVSTTGVEPARANAHYPLKVARLPIPPRGQIAENLQMRWGYYA